MQIRAGGIPLRLLNSIAAARRGAKRNDGRGAGKSVGLRKCSCGRKLRLRRLYSARERTRTSIPCITGAKRNGGRGRVNPLDYGNAVAGVHSACAGLQRKVPAGIGLPADVLHPAGKHGILCGR